MVDHPLSIKRAVRGALVEAVGGPMIHLYPAPEYQSACNGDFAVDVGHRAAAVRAVMGNTVFGDCALSRSQAGLQGRDYTIR